jgi:hypothetical protein
MNNNKDSLYLHTINKLSNEIKNLKLELDEANFDIKQIVNENEKLYSIIDDLILKLSNHIQFEDIEELKNEIKIDINLL